MIAVKKELRRERKALSYHPECSADFTLLELESAIATMKQKKAPGFDNMFGEFIKYFGVNARQWILDFFNTMRQTGRVPTIFKKVKLITVLKPVKDRSDVPNYRPLSLLSRVYTLFERMILN